MAQPVRRHQSNQIETDSQAGRMTLLNAVIRIGEQWNLPQSTLAAILQKHRSSMTEWMNRGEIPNPTGPTKEALQNLIAVYRSLGSIFQSPSDQIKWLEAKHPDLAENTPLEKMQESMEGLITVRRYLDYVRGRGA